MIEAEGMVVAVDGQYAWVETERRSGCDGCAKAQGCGTGTLAKAFGNRMTRFRVPNTLSAEINTGVIVGLPEESLVRGALLVYLVPLITLLGAALLAAALGGTEGVIAIAGVAGLGMGLAAVRVLGKETAALAGARVVMLRRLPARVSERNAGCNV